jgi:N-acylglucosamine-6-phosphate 2-epimerase
MKNIRKLFPRGLIVSCQALAEEPLHGAEIMARMARAAEMSGAIGIRTNSPPDVAAIRAEVNLPIIGLYKKVLPGCDVYITPKFEFAAEVARAGADVIALDATARPRPAGEDLPTLIRRIHDELGLPVMADISTAKEAATAEQLGADVVGTTLSGYTPYSAQSPGPDFELLADLLKRLAIPVFAEGRFHTPDDAARALEMGCHAVVVGGAITRPQEIARRFFERIEAVQKKDTR